jgi:predicted acylesterase/phospholipase RssA
MRGLALSGGGFRATLFHLGVISYLYDVESAWRSEAGAKDGEGATSEETTAPPPEATALTGIKYITSVSGGSILAAHLVLNWEKYTDFENPKNFEDIANEIVQFTKKDIRGRIVRRLPYSIWVYVASVLWRKSSFLNENMPAWMRRSTADALERSYDKHLYRGAILKNLKAKNRPELFLLTTNLGSEVSASAFTSEGLWTASKHYPHATVRLSRAVTASSAFPGMFPAVLYDPIDQGAPELKLSDGGIYDNLGVRKYWDLFKAGKKIQEVIVSDASVRFRSSFGLEFLEPVTVPVKAADILFRRVYSFEVEAAEPKDGSNQKGPFTFLKLRHTFKEDDPEELALISDHQECLHAMRTDLDRFSDLEIAALIRHGYSVARNVLKLRVPDGVSLIPKWTPLSASGSTITVCATIATAGVRKRGWTYDRRRAIGPEPLRPIT